MYSSAAIFDSCFVLKDPGSSSTSPSRLPKIFVEYHPSSPSIRALNAGASTVFIMVCPVLKSLPQIATLCSSASCWMAGISTVRFRRVRSEEHTSELQSRQYLVCRLLLEKKKITGIDL